MIRDRRASQPIRSQGIPTETAMTYRIDVVRETPPLILVDSMLCIGSLRPLHSNLSLDRLHISTGTLF